MREDKGRLGAYVRNARTELGFHTLGAWAEHLGISERTLGDLERGRGAGPNTLAAVENNLDWTPGSARVIMRGGEPTPRSAPAQGPQLTEDEQRFLDGLGELPDNDQQAFLMLYRLRRDGVPIDPDVLGIFRDPSVTESHPHRRRGTPG